MKKLFFCVLFSFTSLIFAQQTSPVKVSLLFLKDFTLAIALKLKAHLLQTINFLEHLIQKITLLLE